MDVCDFCWNGRILSKIFTIAKFLKYLFSGFFFFTIETLVTLQTVSQLLKENSGILNLLGWFYSLSIFRLLPWQYLKFWWIKLNIAKSFLEQWNRRYFVWRRMMKLSLPKLFKQDTQVIVFNWNHFEMRFLIWELIFYLLRTCRVRGAADRGIESLRFQVSIVRR